MSDIDANAEEPREKLKRRADEIANLFLARAGKFRKASLFAKIALISIGSAISAVAQFAQFPATGPTAWQIAGIGASLVVAVGGVFVWLTEEDAPKELSVAHAAVEKAREALLGYEEFYKVAEENDRLVYLVQSLYLMRSVIERAAEAKMADDRMASLILDACDRSLPIAMGFQQQDQWTVASTKRLDATTVGVN